MHPWTISGRLAAEAGALIVALSLMSGAAFACACCGTHGVTGVSDDDILNIRRRATARSTKVGQIPAGFCGIRRLGPRRGRWVKIRYGETTGWVHSRYIHWIP